MSLNTINYTHKVWYINIDHIYHVDINLFNDLFIIPQIKHSIHFDAGV